MCAALLVPSFRYAIKEISIYYGLVTFTMGTVGGFLNIIVFLSLKTFRQNPCGFYLMIMSIFNLIRLSTALSQLFDWIFDWNLDVYSLLYCKMKTPISITSSLGSITFLCLAVIDQYLVTCNHPRLRQLSNIKLAHRLTIIFICIWILYSIPYPIFYDQILYPSTNRTTCLYTNYYFIRYHIYGFFLVLNNLLSMITVVFALKAFSNARNLKGRPIPVVRRESDKQFTVMVLVQVLINTCAFLPISVANILTFVYINEDDFMFQAKLSFAVIVAFLFSMLQYTTSFYTYVCVSKRFRRQLKYVLFNICSKIPKQNQVVPNQIELEVTMNV